MKKDGNSDKKDNKLIKKQYAYIDEYGDYRSNNNKFNPKYTLYVYKDNENSNSKKRKLQNYLLLILEIPGKINKIIVSYYRNEKYKGLKIKGKKLKEELEEEKKKNFQEIKNNRTFEDFEYFIELKGTLELTEDCAEDLTKIYTFKFDQRNEEENESDNNEEIESNESIKNNDSNENDTNQYISTIAGGIYIFKFKLNKASI